MEPSGPRSDHPVLWIVTGSHGSGGCLVSSLKRRHSTFFFPLYSVVWSMLNKFNPNPSNETLASLSEIWITLNHSLPLPHSLNHSLNHSLVFASLPRRHCSSAQIATHSHAYLCLSLTLISASLPRRRCSSLSASSLSPSFGTLSFLILLSFMSIYILWIGIELIDISWCIYVDRVCCYVLICSVFILFSGW